MSAHADFAAVLLAPTFQCPPGLMTWNGSDPAKRFGVYRNNVLVSLIDALADSHPVVQTLVGEDFFRAMAREFVLRSPPRSPVLAWYGDGFADFIASFEPAIALPYLADVARLEWLRVESWHAADAPSPPIVELSALAGDSARLPAARFILHPSLRVLRSAWPVVSIWAAHQSDDPGAALADIDMNRTEAALLVRPELDVEIIPIPPAATDFVEQLRTGIAFGPAVAAAACDVPQIVAMLIRGKAVLAISATEEAA